MKSSRTQSFITPTKISSKIIVQLFEEQLAAIEASFAYHDWNWDPGREEEVLTLAVSVLALLIPP